MGNVDKQQRLKVVYVLLAEAAVMGAIGALLLTGVIAPDIGIPVERLAAVCAVIAFFGLTVAGMFVANMGDPATRRFLPLAIYGTGMLVMAGFLWAYLGDSEIRMWAAVIGVFGVGTLGVAVHKFLNPSE